FLGKTTTFSRRARCLRCGAAHLAALAEADHTKGCARLVAAPDHVEIAHLEDAQGQPAAREQDGLQREEGQLRQLEGIGGRGTAQSLTTASALWRCSMASTLATVAGSSRRSQMKSTAPL